MALLPHDPPIASRLIPPSAYRVMPWRNGGGTTSEIACEGMAPGSAAGRFRWRLSLADVEASGPFSDFSGYERIIAVASGAGMRLAIGGDAVELDAASDPFRFPGDAAVECRLLAGSIRDFNLIFDPALCRGAVERLRFAEAPTTRHLAGGTTLLYALGGPVECRTEDGAALAVPEGATLRLDGAGHVAMAGASGAQALLATVVPRIS
jgi:environmental stress-induced protein Ves